MTLQQKETQDRVRFCVKYLLEHGIDDGDKFSAISQSLPQDAPEFDFVQTSTIDYFAELAIKLRELWPAGEKDGKWPWRDSVANTTNRLRSLWKERKLEHYPIDMCLEVANRYLAEFRNDTRYMRILKYFIMKQKPVYYDRKGMGHVGIESIFADMLQGKTESERESDIARVLENSDYNEGEII